ncbi:MAG: PEP-CTERM sorting domain-containing protein [Candidatus Brocadiae bacterium]|nr:PEP-CTERM sorting domain-containing protein [Candidatus Brocadiia bacterium]
MVKFLMLLSFVFSLYAYAVPIQPAYYNMQNGETGSYLYWDETYTGSGNKSASLSWLTGGLGDLTNGVLATNNWNVDEAQVGSGPYVGWYSITPVITFHFAGPVSINKIRIHADHSNGSGGVSLPGSIQVAASGFDQTFAVTNTTGDYAPRWIDLQGFLLNNIQSLSITIYDGAAQWVFISEVAFEGTVPEPASWMILSISIGLYLLAKHKK